jgi:fatty-acyl-CoA synthase
MRDQGLGSWPARRARKTPDRVAIRSDGTDYTYRQLYERVSALAGGLREQGVGSGDRVAFLGANQPAYLETLFAVAGLGAIFVPLNTRLSVDETAYLLTDSGSDVLIVGAAQHDVGHESAGRAGVAKVLDVDSGYQQLIATQGPNPPPIDEPIDPAQPCVIMYTSGTTGRPKGAVLSHANLTWNSVNVLVDIDLAGDEVTLVVAPLFHTAGLNMTCLPTLLKGGTVVLMAAFTPEAVLAQIERHQVTYMFGVPTMYEAMAANPAWPDTDLSSLRQVSCGGAPVPEHLIKIYLDRGLAFSQGYGMTEAAPGVLYLDRGAAARKAGTAGVPHFFSDVRLVSPDGRDVAVGDPGEVLVSGPNVFDGYWRRPQERAHAFDGEWFRSGDIATVDDEGYVTIVDRLKDMIISGGENIYPAEVERVLAAHPAVQDCAVIGVPDPRWGEVPRAIVVLRPGMQAGTDEIIAFIRERLAGYKTPASVLFADSLPRTGSGKLQKTDLRSQYGS